MIDSLIFYFNFNFPLEYTMKRYSKEENYNKERIVCHLKFIIHTWCVNRRETIVQFAGSYKIECCINVQPSVSQEYSVNGLILPNLKDPVFVVVTAQLIHFSIINAINFIVISFYHNYACLSQWRWNEISN